jgi:iron complex outermembrane receptor protein
MMSRRAKGGRMTRKPRAGLLATASGVTLVATLFAAHANAQTARPASTGTMLGEVVVTAQKRAENIQNTPEAVTAIPGQRLVQGNVNQPVKLQFIVPSMTFGTEDGFTYLTLRGVGNDATSLAESSVATYMDGVYTGMMISESVPSFDLSRVEVLRGPQGTLYGRNTTGGVINYITKIPSFDPGLTADVSYGNYNAVQTNLDVTGPIVADKVAARFTIHYGDHDGYYPNIATNVRDYADRNIGGRIAVLVQPTDNLQVIIRGDMAHDHFNDSFALIHGTALDGFTDDTHPLGIFSQTAGYFETHPGFLSPADITKLNGGSIASYYGLLQAGPAAPNPFKTQTVANGSPTFFDTDSNGASVTIDWHSGSVDVKSISAYRFSQLLFNNDSGGVSYPSVDFVPFIQNENQWTQEIDVSGRSFNGKLDWLAGFFYYHDAGFLGANVYLPSFQQFEEASIELANPPGSAYLYNLNAAQLTNLNNLPGVVPNNLATVVYSYGGFMGGPFVHAQSTIPPTGFLGFLQKQESQSIAGFFQGTYHITDSLRFTGGFRLTNDQKTAYRQLHSNLIWALASNGLYEAAVAGVIPLPPGVTPEQFVAATAPTASGLCNTNTEKSWTAPTGTVGLDYDAAPHVLTYAKASWGYKAGGMNPGECTHIYNPEYLTDYEGGLKSVFADGQILTNLAIYYYDYKNIQFTTYIHNASEILNAGSANAFGVELEYQVQPHFAPGWELDGSASFEDSHYGTGCFGDPANINNAAFLDTPIQPCPATVINPTTGLPVPIGPSAAIKGNELIRAPRWKTNVGLQYTYDMQKAGNVLARVEGAWTDTIYNDIFNGKVPFLSQWTQPGYWILNAHIVWTSADNRWAAEIFGENLTNSIYAANRVAFNTPATVYNLGGQLGPPQTYGVRVTMKLGSGR